MIPGTRVGAYEIVGPLGAGGMGEVLRARDTRLGREVALKLLPAAFASDPGRLARFEREARSIAALNHPNIVVLHSIEEANGVRFLIMELVEGRTLDQLTTPGGLPLPRLLELAVPLADALVAAHERGIVHRDLKPGNVMITREGRVKVLDFGLAKIAEEPVTAVTHAATLAAPITSDGQVMGTVPYMAPEQLRGQAVDARTDLFAFGVMLYEMATGRRPFIGATSSDISSAILRDAPVPAAILRTDLPRDLGRIIARCLEKDPRERFQTARDVYNELRIVQREIERATPEPALVTAALAPITDETPSIAVLPFVNMSRDEENEYFADGLSEELLNVLAKVRGLRVAARTSSFSFKGKGTKIAEVGRELNVKTVLEGSVRKAGKRVRISAQLVKVADGYHLWSETYDRELEDIFAVQDDIAQAVVKELKTTLLGGKPDSKASEEARADVAAAARGRGVNPEAHRLYLQGMFFFDRWTPEEIAKGMGFYRRAVELEPGYALAWAGLSQIYSAQAGLGLLPLKEGYERAREAAQRALSIEPDLPEGHAAMARIQMLGDWDWQAASASVRRALELNPGNVAVLRQAGLLAASLGRLEEAMALVHRGIELDPLNIRLLRNLAEIHLEDGRADEAEAAVRRALEVGPHSGASSYSLGMVLLAKGRPEEALEAGTREPIRVFGMQIMVLAHHALGNAQESDRLLEEMIAEFADSGACQIAEIYARRGEKDLAFEWLDRAVAQRDPGLANSNVSWFLRPLHNDPRWQPYLRKLGLDTTG